MLFNFELNGISCSLAGNTVNIGGVTNIMTPPPDAPGNTLMKNFVAEVLGALNDIHNEPEKVIEAIASDTGMIKTRDKSQSRPITALKPLPLSESKVFKFIVNALYVNDGNQYDKNALGRDELSLDKVSWQQAIHDILTFLSKFGGIENAVDGDAQASYYDDLGDHILARCGASVLAEDILTTPFELIWSYMATVSDLPSLRRTGLAIIDANDKVGKGTDL